MGLEMGMGVDNATPCPLCVGDGGELVWRGEKLRVIRAQEPLYPAWYRVIWNGHVKEFSQLGRDDRLHCMDMVNTVEQVLIEHLQPTKINLAQFGNMVPHLHWHIIARFDWDAHFPNPSWGATVRAVDALDLQRITQTTLALDEAIHLRCSSATIPHGM
jgi:diadenosine tetraphosphate (Ap4A) HIT family hydrolase